MIGVVNLEAEAERLDELVLPVFPLWPFLTVIASIVIPASFDLK